MPPPILVNRPVRMRYAEIIVPVWSIDETIRILQELGAVHVVEKGKGIEEYLLKYKKVRQIINKINAILEYAKGRVIDASLTVTDLKELSIDSIDKEITKLYNNIKAYHEELNNINNELSQINELVSILSRFDPETPMDRILYSGRLLSIITVYGAVEQFESFKLICCEKGIHIEAISHIASETIHIYSIAFFGSLNKIIPIIESCGLRYLDITPFIQLQENLKVGDVVNNLLRRAEELREKLTELQHKVEKLIDENIDYLGKYLLFLENKIKELESILRMHHYKYLSVLQGWIPADKTTDLMKKLKENNIAYYMEVRDPIKGRDEPPTLLKNPKVIEWFEPIVKFIGIPRYWEWDPTPIIAYSFALFYGIMLGDMGYAIAIILAAILILDKFVDDPHSRDYVFFKRSLIVSSVIGFIVGSLSGSFFGAQLFAFTEMFTDPLKFLILAILIGLIHVNISHALTLVKSIKEKAVGEALSESGLFITEIFGIPYVMHTMLHVDIPWISTTMYSYLLVGAMAGIILIIVGMVKSMGGLGLLMWLFQLTGLLGDVLSYSRLAGVGLATIYLGQSFNRIAILAYNGISSMVPVNIAGAIVGGILVGLILFFGHLLNTALSALGGFIHSLRLCFVEFLSKFYDGTGYPYEPLKIVARKRIVIG